jgi:hypothetical protein
MQRLAPLLALAVIDPILVPVGDVRNAADPTTGPIANYLVGPIYSVTQSSVFSPTQNDLTDAGAFAATVRSSARAPRAACSVMAVLARTWPTRPMPVFGRGNGLWTDPGTVCEVVMLCRLIYTSQVVTPFGFGDLQAILEKARRNNPALDATGLLVMVSQRFLQVIEGPAENVNLLYRKISADPRHSHCSLVEFGPITARLFDAWSMRAIHPGVMNQQLRTLLARKYGAD